MTRFQKVALLGKGTLGTLLLDELLEANFTVTILTRANPTNTTLQPNVTLKQVDYSSTDSLESALAGHDIVISTLTPTAIPLQKPAIDASIAVGVKRFIPADYGAISSDPAAQKLPFNAAAVGIQNYLRERESQIEHTIFATGAFLDRVFTMPVAVDFTNRAVRLYDDGRHGFSVSRAETVARAIVRAIQRPEETKNRVVRAHDAVLTQREVYDLARKWIGPEGWTEVHVNAQEQLDGALAKMQEGFDPALLPGMFVAALFSGEFYAAYRKEDLDNDLLGLEVMGREEVEAFGLALVNRYQRNY
ncbi:hypothetical protein BDW74DRAFT_185273 [Aspergillus multicolor]|uniref:aromatic alcohol reductase n=1 Tax=Aspergillus multicolor TaxID=41759 RepID=UPI003CCD5840